LWKNRVNKEKSNQLVNDLSNSKIARVRERAAIGLGKLGSSEAIPFLIQALEREKDFQVIGHIIEAIGKMGDTSQAISVLKKYSTNQEICELWTGEGYESKKINQIALMAMDNIVIRLNSLDFEGTWLCSECQKINPITDNTCVFCNTLRKSTPEVQPINLDAKLLETGSTSDWLKEFKKFSRNKGKIKLSQPVHPEKDGYKNLLIALYSAEQNLRFDLILVDKSLIKAVEYFREFRQSHPINVEPSSSSRTNLDNLLGIITKGSLPEKTTEANIIKYTYKFFDAFGQTVEIEKKTILDLGSKKAITVCYEKT
jgi:hypothetical protein